MPGWGWGRSAVTPPQKGQSPTFKPAGSCPWRLSCTKATTNLEAGLPMSRACPLLWTLLAALCALHPYLAMARPTRQLSVGPTWARQGAQAPRTCLLLALLAPTPVCSGLSSRPIGGVPWGREGAGSLDWCADGWAAEPFLGALTPPRPAARLPLGLGS